MTTGLHILILASNAFKNSLNVEDVASAIRAGLKQSNLHCSCECFLVRDGVKEQPIYSLKKV